MELIKRNMRRLNDLMEHLQIRFRILEKEVAKCFKLSLFLSLKVLEVIGFCSC